MYPRSAGGGSAPRQAPHRGRAGRRFGHLWSGHASLEWTARWDGRGHTLPLRWPAWSCVPSRWPHGKWLGATLPPMPGYRRRSTGRSGIGMTLAPVPASSRVAAYLKRPSIGPALGSGWDDGATGDSHRFFGNAASINAVPLKETRHRASRSHGNFPGHCSGGGRRSSKTPKAVAMQRRSALNWAGRYPPRIRPAISRARISKGTILNP